MKRIYWLWLAIGCGLDPFATKDSGGDWQDQDRGGGDADADTDADTDADADADITYPTEDMTNILLYHGHGGPDGLDPYGWGVFNSIIPNHWRDAHGWYPYWQPNLPDSDGFAYYRMIALIGPGASADVSFSEADRIKLRRTLDNGTRIVLFMDRGTCDNPEVDALLQELGVTMRMRGDGAGVRLQVSDVIIREDQQITANVGSVLFTDPCYISKNDATPLITWERDGEKRVLAAVERPGSGGDVVIVGDFEILDDSGNFYESDNHTLVDNLATVKP